jgi:hypothetical protein
MGIETDADYDGANCSFTSAIITIEGILSIIWFQYKQRSNIVLLIELAKVDPAISVICDVQVRIYRSNIHTSH